MKFLKNLLLNIRIILSPNQWIQIYPQSKPWDKELNEFWQIIPRRVSEQ
jgi:hypothetical protein